MQDAVTQNLGTLVQQHPVARVAVGEPPVGNGRAPTVEI